MAKVRKYKHKLPQINGEIVVVPQNKLTEALELMWSNQIEPEEVDGYMLGDWN